MIPVWRGFSRLVRWKAARFSAPLWTPAEDPEPRSGHLVPRAPVRVYPWRVIGWTPEGGFFRFTEGVGDLIRDVGREAEATLARYAAAAPRRPRRGVELFLIGEDEFRGMVADAIDALPDRFRAEVGRSVEFLVEPEIPEHVMAGVRVLATEPVREKLRALGWPEHAVRRAWTAGRPEDFYPQGTLELYGVYVGVTLPDRARAPHIPRLPSVIFLFMGPCLRANVDEDALRFQVRNLVEHELAHHFGLNEADVAAAHRRKRSQERKNPGY